MDTAFCQTKMSSTSRELKIAFRARTTCALCAPRRLVPRPGPTTQCVLSKYRYSWENEKKCVVLDQTVAHSVMTFDVSASKFDMHQNYRKNL